MKQRPIFFALSLTIAPPLCAQTEALDTVVVEGDLIPQIGDVAVEEFTGSHTTIDSEKLQRGDASLAEIIAHESGVQYRQSGGLGSYSSVTVRGASGAQTGVYLDGVLLNDASTGSVDLSQFELLNIGQVDIFRGATPVQLGHSSIGGALNLRTPRFQQDATRVQLGFGSFHTQRLQLAAHRALGRWQLSTALSEQKSDNDFSFTNNNGTPLNPNDDRRERRHNSQFERQSALFRAGFDFDHQRRFDALLQLSQREQGVPEWRNRADNRAEFQGDSHQLQLNYRALEAVGNWSHSSGVFLNQHAERYDDRLSQVGLGAQLTDADTRVSGIRSYWEHLGERSTLSINTQYRHEKQQSDDQLGTRDYRATRDQLSSDWQYAWYSEDERWLLTPGLHLNLLRDDYSGVDRGGFTERDNEVANLKLGARYQWRDDISLNAQWGQHQREPTFFELFGDRGTYLGNSELQEETGQNLELGLTWQPEPRFRPQLGIHAFASWRDDLITSVYDSRGIGRSENVGDARVTGLELSSQWQLNPAWQWRVNLTWQDAENRSEVKAERGKQLPGEARWVAYHRLQYQHKAWRAWHEISVNRDRFYDSANLLAAEDVTLHHVGLGYAHGAWRAELALHNLGDEIVEDFNGFPKPGRNANLSVTYDF